MTRLYKLNPLSIRGSYAGAMGQPQFMPTSMLYYAMDFHGQKNPNLFSDKADVIFSVGNFLRQHGWEPDEPIAMPAKIYGDRYKEIIKKDPMQLLPPQYTLAELARYGIHPAYGYPDLNLQANLIKVEGEKGPEYWIIFQNFYVITRYNNDDLYALAAFKLGQKIQMAYNLKNHKKDEKNKNGNNFNLNIQKGDQGSDF